MTLRHPSVAWSHYKLVVVAGLNVMGLFFGGGLKGVSSAMVRE